MIQNRNEILETVERYNVTGPRYTSYPTAVQFTESFDHETLDRALERRGGEVQDLSLYFHIPFCFSLCWYCGCTKIITRDQDRGDVYLDYLAKEINLVKQTIHPKSTVRQVHFGGGTPTFLTPVQLRRLGALINNGFNIHEDVEFSVEIDPRRCGEEHIIALREIGCNRASLGVQDTNPDVQEAIHRIQPFSITCMVTELLRKHGISEINFDLIYGLPRQTSFTFNQTIDDVIRLDPDRLAVYSYAHLPALMPAQKLLSEDELPSPREKLEMMMAAVERFPEMGYRFIGMDHFAKEEDELSIALDQGTLQRNFQGYSTHSGLEMIAFGMSGISQGDDLYYQNEKDLARYYEDLEEGRLPVKKTLFLSEDDKIRRDVIMQIMCQATIRFETFREKTGFHFKEYFSAEIEKLQPMEADGFLLVMDDQLIIREKGRLFLRNIAMTFDWHLSQKRGYANYSKTV